MKNMYLIITMLILFTECSEEKQQNELITKNATQDHCKIVYSPLLKFSQDFSLVIFGYMLIFLCFFSCFRTDITLLKAHFPLIFTIRPNDPWTSI